MSEATVRTRVTAILANALPEARVHDYIRMVTNESKRDEFLAKGGKLHAWFVGLAPDEPMLTTQSNRTRGRDPMAEYLRFKYHLLGYYAVEDAAASEKQFAAIVTRVFDAYRLDPKLGVTADVQVIESGPPQWVQGGYVQIPQGAGGVFCHHARIEYVAFDDLD